MKRILFAIIFISMFSIAGCGSNQPTATAPVSSTAPPAASVSPEPTTTQSNQAQSSPVQNNPAQNNSAQNSPVQSSPMQSSPAPSINVQEPANQTPVGHLWHNDYKDLLIQINNVEMTKDVFDQEFLVFDLTVKNGTTHNLEVSGRSFALLTVNKELLQYDPTAETVETSDVQTTVVLSGGQRSLRVGFVVQPQDVSELIFSDGQTPVYRITSFDDGTSSSEGSNVQPEPPAIPDESPAIEGGNAKSDDFVFEENYLGYLYALIEAINSGDFSLVEIHLLYDSELYAEQQKLVQSLNAKGIREELDGYEIQSTSYDEESSTLTVTAREKVKVIKPDGTEKMTDNVWTYKALEVDYGVFQFSSIAKAK